MAQVLQCIYKSWPCDDLDPVYGKVNMGCQCIGMGITVKMSFELRKKPAGNWQMDKYWLFWKRKWPKGIICPCTGIKYHNIQTCLLVYAADLRWAFTGPLVLWFLGHLSRRLIRWADSMVVELSSVRLCVCPSVPPFTLSNTNISTTSQPIAIKLYQKYHWGGGKVALGFGQVGSELWFPWQQIALIDLQWEKHKKIFKTARPRAFILCV